MPRSPAGLTPPAQAAITLAIFNAVCASLGGFAGPLAVGAILQALGSFELAAVVLGACAGVAGSTMLGVYFWERRRGAAARVAGDGGGSGGDGGSVAGAGLDEGCKKPQSA